MSKAAKAVTIIGGADGPTSVFLVGHGKKEKNIFKRINMEYRDWKYRRKSRAAQKRIVPGSHTMEETIQYVTEHYNAVETDASYHYYEERKRDSKYGLIQRRNPELLGGEKEIIPPDDFNDQEAVKEWMRQIEEWTEERRRIVDKIPDEVFPTDYHMFIIDKGEWGKLEVEVDTVSEVIGVSYSGDKKVMEPILRNIYLFYGVSQEDIDKKSERYRSLLAALSN